MTKGMSYYVAMIGTALQISHEQTPGASKLSDAMTLLRSVFRARKLGSINRPAVLKAFAAELHCQVSNLPSAGTVYSSKALAGFTCGRATASNCVVPMNTLATSGQRGYALGLPPKAFVTGWPSEVKDIYPKELLKALDTIIAAA